MSSRLVCLAVVLHAWFAIEAQGQALPTPTGRYAVGRVTVHWIDASRVEPLSTDRRNRELMVDIWYPGEQSRDPAT